MFFALKQTLKIIKSLTTLTIQKFQDYIIFLNANKKKLKLYSRNRHYILGTLIFNLYEQSVTNYLLSIINQINFPFANSKTSNLM